MRFLLAGGKSLLMFMDRRHYSSAGCGLSLHHTEKPDHEEVCEFRPYTCPCPGATCKWHGSLEAVMPHLMHAHKSITTLQGEDIVFLATDINLPGAVDWVMMQSCFSHHFMLVLEKQEKYEGHQQFFAVVLLIGTRKQAENFAYRLELNGNRRRLTWEATPRSIHDGVAAAIMNSDCLRPADSSRLAERKHLERRELLERSEQQLISLRASLQQAVHALSSELVTHLLVRDQLRTKQDAMLLDVQDLT
ncbi:hypothetical protein PFLUV_G00186780 [Perca fluviatilis]|uniref:E3 ubiquitin-protein ligase n=1 Tax=Perca fluviatilis TaxID=8168 RepID=A0A6A5EGV8_PERFL|nr:hypothetical protein PFLUV_G00186780 [Perca fluviatilis]